MPRTTRRQLLKLAGKAAAAAALAPAILRAAGTEGRPNVLFIPIDDLRPQLGCYGDTLVKSPNLDALAARGHVFTHAYCQQALCSPSRTALLTGLRPDTTTITSIGPHFRDFVPNVVTLPQHFKNHGYVTRAIGKVFHNGLDDAASWSAPHEDSKVSGYTAAGQACQRQRVAEAKAKGVDFSKKNVRVNGPAWEVADLPDNGLHDGANTDRALEIMREIKDRPFFLAVGFSKPHIPYVAPKKYWDLYDPQKIEFAKNQYPPKDAPAFAVQGLGELWTYDLAPQPSLPDGIKRSLIHGYLACISYIDTQVGRLLAELDRLGLRESTIVIAWGDNGYQLGEHGMWSSKHTCYETSALVPLIVGLPGQKGGRKIDALVEFMDIYPTLAELCGLPFAGGLEGTSFRPLLDRPDRPWKKAAFNQYPRGGYNGHAIRTDRWRLVEWRKAGQAPLYELYDHQADPQENSNIAGRPEGAKVAEELAAQLKAGWQAARPA